jgi:excisionase family DNA binding protein
MPKKQYDKKDALTMTVDEVAEALGVSKYLVWEMVRRNEIRSIKLGKLRRIPRTALTELLEGNADDRKGKPSE